MGVESSTLLGKDVESPGVARPVFVGAAVRWRLRRGRRVNRAVLMPVINVANAQWHDRATLSRRTGDAKPTVKWVRKIDVCIMTNSESTN